jgi:predicted small lipoprotein YifL
VFSCDESRRSISRAILFLLLGALALAPAACGRKGDPVLPPPQTDQYPHQYPKSTDPQQGVFN